MKLSGGQVKRISDDFIKSIGQQFGSIAPDKSTCKCEKDLNRLKDVHLVSTRRHLFEGNRESTEKLFRNSYQNQDGNSDSKRGSKTFDVNHERHPEALRRGNSRNSLRENKLNPLDNYSQKTDDHNNNAVSDVLSTTQNDRDAVEKYRNYVIKSIIDDFNGEKIGNYDDAEVDNEEIKVIENCEDVNDMIKNETWKTSTLSHHLVEHEHPDDGFDNSTSSDIREKPEKIADEFSHLSTKFKEKGSNEEMRDSNYFTNDSDSASEWAINEETDISECKCKELHENEIHVHEDNLVIDNNKKRKSRLSRFNRLSLKKQKHISDTDFQCEDEDDIFGHMISDDEEYCLEVINADGEVTLNKISLKRVCISNIVIQASPASEKNRDVSINDTVRIFIEEDKTNNEVPEDINIRTTVYYDQNSNPRIEKVIDENKLHVVVNEDKQENSAPPLSPTLPNKRQDLIIKELLETELTFIEGLRIAIEEYMAYFKEHENKKYSNTFYLKSLFGNIEKMYAEAQKFYTDLLMSDYNIEKIAFTFLEHENLFDVFVEYIKNKPTSQSFSSTLFRKVSKDRHAQLQDKERLDLESYLLTPIQRLGRYILFMENLQKVTKAMNGVSIFLNEATDFLKREMKRADTFVAAVSIGNCPVDLTKKGSYVAKETFNIKRKYKSVVFIFQEIVVFTVPNQHRTESYFYKESIEMSDLTIRSDQEQPLTFNLRSFSKTRNYEESPYSFELEASSEKVKRKWVQEIENLLWEQLEKCKANALSGEAVYRKFNKAASSTNSPNYYKKKKQPEVPATPSSVNNERRSIFYVGT